MNNVLTTLKFCKRCQIEQPFYVYKGRAANCVTCRKRLSATYYINHREEQKRWGRDWRKANLEKSRASGRQGRLKRSLALAHITAEQFAAISTVQNNLCYVCKQSPRRTRLDIDHSHDTGMFRGLLCGRCNTVLGLVADSQELLQKLICYLEQGGLQLVA